MNISIKAFFSHSTTHLLSDAKLPIRTETERGVRFVKTPNTFDILLNCLFLYIYVMLLLIHSAGEARTQN